ncbi:MAG TPA: S46 family peptidase, partial [Thermoanaerobaculia bacterium]
PRHTGDFAIARAYLNGEPYKPEFFFPIAKEGVDAGDFVMILGYPGVTYRSLIGDEMEERRDLFFPRREEVFGEQIRIIEETTKGSPEGTIAMADHLKTLLNRYKNAQGQIAGFRRGRILEKQRTADDAVLAWAKGKSEHAAAVAAHQRLQQLVREQRATWERDFLLALIPIGVRSVPGAGASLPKSLYYGVTLARTSRERQKPDAQRESSFGEKDLPRVRQRLESDQRAYFAPTDKAILLSWIRRARRLAPERRVATVDRIFGGISDEQLSAEIERMYAATKVFDLQARWTMFSETPEQLRARKDPILDLGFTFDDELKAFDTLRQKGEGEIADTRPQWRRAVIAHAGKPVSPDANRTLRVSLAHVKGYEPRDAVIATPFTTIEGVIEKHTGEEPFDVPGFVLEAVRKDPAPRSVPVNFLADGDTTGGNSGSPVVNGRGELVGVNFDRVWENVANDFGYNPDIARNISADMRYLLWILAQTPGAEGLLREIGAARVMEQKK